MKRKSAEQMEGRKGRGVYEGGGSGRAEERVQLVRVVAGAEPRVGGALNKSVCLPLGRHR